MMQIKIRRLNIEDVTTLLAISKQTFFDTFSSSCTKEDMQLFLQEHYNTERLTQELADETMFFYFAEIENKPVGYLLVKEDYNGFTFMKKWKALELKRIYVINEFQGKGIAQALMDFAIKYAVDNCFEVIWLGVWEHNERAKNFYSKYGFIDSGHTHDFPIGTSQQTDKWFWKFLINKSEQAK